MKQSPEPHGSFPANPLLAEPLYLAKYIERTGTGTRDMIRLCREAGLRATRGNSHHRADKDKENA